MKVARRSSSLFFFFFTNSMALISSTRNVVRKVVRFCNDIGMRSNDTSFRSHPPLAFSAGVLYRHMRALVFKTPKTIRHFFIPSMHRQHGFSACPSFFPHVPAVSRDSFFSLARLRSSNCARSHLFHFAARSYGFKCKFRACRTASVDRFETVSPGHGRTPAIGFA